MSIPEMLRSSWLTDLSLGERGGSFDSALALDDDTLCSSLKLRLLNSPTRFFGFTLTAGNVYKIKQECIPVGCVPPAAVAASVGSQPDPLPPEQAPPGASPPPDQAPPAPGSPPVDRHTPLNILPCPKLRLQAVTRIHSSRLRTTHLFSISCSTPCGGLSNSPWMETPATLDCGP